MKKKGRGFVWTEKEEKQLLDIYGSTKVKDLVIFFGRSKTAIIAKAAKLRLKRNIKVRDYNRGCTERKNIQT